MEKIIAIIVTYNGMKWYDRCFSSLAESDYPIDVLVVDNCSSDGSVNYIKSNFPEVIVLESKENLGFGGANNLGMLYALEKGYDHVFLVNQDTWIFSETVGNLVNAVKDNPGFGIYSPVHFSHDEVNLDHNFQYYLLNNQTDEETVLQQVKVGEKVLVSTDFVNAAFWFMPIQTLKIIGGFDPIFKHYGEDDNYVQRVKYHDLKVGVVADSKAVHARKQPEINVEDKNQSGTNPIRFRHSYRKYLVILADVNGTFVANLFKLVFINFKYSVLDLVNFRFKSFWSGKMAILQVLKNFGKIYSSHSINRKKGLSHLN